MRFRVVLTSCVVVVTVGSCSSSSDPGSISSAEVQKSSSDPPPPTPGAPSPTPASSLSSPLFVGRFDTTDAAGPKAAWPGSRILARFDGTAVSVKLSEHADSWMDGAPSYWEVTIDKGPWQAIRMISDDQPHDFDLASGLAPGPHEVEIYKRSETQTGITQFLGFDFHGGQGLPPPERQTRKIEVMGDSFATGFGVEMVGAPSNDCPGPDWGGIWENFRKSWGGLLGTMFDAEVHGVVYSGKGLLKNIWPTDDDPLRAYYPRANPDPAIAHKNPPLFDLQSWIPDVIVLTQGSCDFDGSGSVTDSEFESAYHDFVVDVLRARGADTHIFMGVVGSGARDEVASAARKIIAERAAVGDDKMHLFLANMYTAQEMTACDGHGTPAWHQRIANEIAAEIRAKVGWQ
jgi:hypothetical protein